MTPPIRILQIVNIMDRAGIETMLMNYYRNIDRSKVQFDFLTHREEDGAYDDEIKALGGRIYKAPRLMPQNYPRYFSFMKKFFRDHPEYRVVHSHIDAMSSFPLRAARKANIDVRIAHSHSSKLDRDIKLPIKYISKLLIPKYANCFFACGKKAGNFLFGKKEFYLVNNAVDLYKFGFNENIREKIRRDIGADEDCFVLGHVGRYIYIKNQKFLLDVFKLILEKKENSILLLIGMGPDEKELRQKVKELGIEKKVRFLINKANVHELYQAMDCFVMPSLFEGLPVVGVEAQANGLTCLFSDKISKEVIMTNNSRMINLELGAQQWANHILDMEKSRNTLAREELKKANYDVANEAEKLMNVYINLYEKGN